jgi:pimeloyl-ACP methyl ester carboxylesterase
MYKPAKSALPLDLNIRDLRYRIHCWGNASAIPVFLLHGWADVGMSFQFLADKMSEDWYLLAPDWRGFGESQWQPGGYWFPDYLADLEMLIDHISPTSPVRLVGHSMGGNVAWLYAGVRPERVSHAVSLDVYGLDDSPPELAPAHYGMWLDQLKQIQLYSQYADIDGVIERILKIAPNMDSDKAAFLACYWCDEAAEGSYHLRHDPAHKRVNPILYRRQEAMCCWQEITAKVMLVLATESSFYERYESQGYQAELHANIRQFKETSIDRSGHMVHLEQPSRLAAILDDFLRE